MGRWIPPGGLLAGHAAHGSSWILLLYIAVSQSASPWAPLAWLHLVALGWLTLIALAVLVHVIPGFTGIEWRWEVVARCSLGVYGAGVAMLVVAFLSGMPLLFPIAGGIIAVAVSAYLVPAFATLLGYRQLETRERAIARALFLTLVMFAATVALGFALALALGTGVMARVLTSGPAVHATLGIVGWLTILITGVSARTIFPITRARSRWRLAHVAVGALLLTGTIVLAAGLALWNALALAGLTCIGVAVAVYAADILDIVRRASNPHRAPQAFVVFSILWLVVAFVLAAAAIGAGRSEYVAAMLYLALVGWAGQMLNGHLHHIGVRVLATMVRGDEDETRPIELLSAPLSWLAFASLQAAVGVGAVALVARSHPWLAAAAISGFCGFVAMSANVAVARRKALA
jgi:hypothetical protein